MKGFILGLAISGGIWYAMNHVVVPTPSIWAVVAMLACAAAGRSN